MDSSLIQVAGVIALAGLVGGALPLARAWSPRILHALVAVAAGVFIGSVLHVLADAAMVPGQVHAHGHELSGHGGHGHAHDHGSEGGGIAVWLGLAGGFFGLWLLSSLGPGRRLAKAHDHDVHGVAWRVTYFGLVFHALLAGIGLAPLVGQESVEWGLVGSFAAHKATEVLSLATLMSLARVSLRRIVVLLGLFVLVTPTALCATQLALLEGLGDVDWAIGLAGGTFLYVGLFDLLPEAFHDSDDRGRSALLVLIGVTAGALLPGGDLSGLAAVPALTLDVFLELAPFLLFGFAIAGVLSEWLDPKRIEPWLSGERFGSVGTASVIGAPLPLCSCSVVPVAATLRDAGASRGATSAFLIATPETGVDSIAVTYGLLGPVMAVARPLSAVLSALGVGALVGRFSRDEAPDPEAEAAHSCCHHDHDHGHDHGHAPEPEPEASCCASSKPKPPTVADRLGRALQHGFVRMVDDLAMPLVLGVLAAGVLAALIPAEAFTGGVLEGPLGYLAMLAIGLPIYVCASASTPLAATLIAKGLNPGAALVLLLAAPATNIGSLLVMRRLIGRRGLIVHLVALSVATVACGALLDVVIAATGWTLLPQVGDHVHLLGGPVHALSAIVLGVLLVGTAWRKFAGRSAPVSTTDAAAGNA